MQRRLGRGAHKARGFLWGLTALVTSAAACSVDKIDLSGKQCPCASGWECDPVTNTCLPKGAAGAAGAAGTAGAAGSGGSGGTATGGSGGTGGSAGAAGASGQAGAGGSAGASGAAGSGGAAGGCSSSQKWCAGQCVSNTSTSHGCAGPSCDPCADYANSSPICNSGTCSISCTSGYGNCDSVLTNGCEQKVNVSDAQNCGKCGRTCSTSHASSTSCDGASCKPVCTAPYANCNESSHPLPDDGCERNLDTSTTSCGRCGYSCTAQGGVSSKFGCYAGRCGCSTAAQCMTEAGLANVSCDATNHVCLCGASTCAKSEVCIKQGSSSACACNGVSKCTGGTSCCSTGCKDLDTDPANCGVCGKACSSGQICAGGFCL